MGELLDQVEHDWFLSLYKPMNPVTQGQICLNAIREHAPLKLHYSSEEVYILLLVLVVLAISV